MDRATQKAVPLSWESPPSRLPGLGPTAASALGAFGIRTVGDLLWTLPAGYDDLRSPLSVDDAVARAGELEGRRITVIGAVESKTIVPMRGRRTLRVIVAGERAKIHAWWFFLAHGVYKAAEPGTPVLLIGQLRIDPKKPPRMAHPDFLAGSAPAVRVRYPRYGVPGATLRKAIGAALSELGDSLPDPVPHEIAVREGMPASGPLLRAVHAAAGEPPTSATVERVRERIAWAEVFTRTFDRLRMEARAAAENGASRGVPLAARVTTGELEAAFGFSFTASQSRAVVEIGDSLEGARPTRRLLLGDVGTGKTAVALSAAVQAIRSGAQAALLAPTTVLAEQYLDATRPIVDAFGVRVTLLTGGLPAAERKRRLAAIAAGEVDLVVGTHALLSESVKLAKLGLVVVDEQHRLGVAQRLALVQKGARPHLLTLSATPIPRTLALALRGDLPVTTLDERPRGRPPVTTELLRKSASGPLTERIAETVRRGEQVFVVCPLIEDGDDESDDEAPLASAVARYEALSAALAPTPVTLVHGALGHVKKTEAMRAFRHGEARVLVGTTVVEVGVDVPAATLMIVEGAERFGLAQLHQLRGRVGRGAVPGTCVLVHEDDLGDLARARLDALARLDKGEDVARADLELRGAGDLWGTKQSGDEDGLAYLAPGESPSWLARIPADAAAVLVADPELRFAEHRALRLAVERFRTALSVREEAG